MQRWQRIVLATPFPGRAMLIALRAKIALGYFRGPLSRLFKWLLTSREITNFTYDLETTNKRYLGALVADITGIPFGEAMAYMREIEEDENLRQHVADATGRSEWGFMADKDVRYGRRIGWYAFTRALKPRVVIETGVDKGLGACVLTAALMRNKQEGHVGRYYGTDINPRAGYLLSSEYAAHGCILYGDSIETLRAFDGTIDLFVNDSAHTADYEAGEYAAVADKLSAHAVILGDNCHCTDTLLEFSLATRRRFVFFREQPRGHWYPGGGIGIAFRR